MDKKSQLPITDPRLSSEQTDFVLSKLKKILRVSEMQFFVCSSRLSDELEKPQYKSKSLMSKLFWNELLVSEAERTIQESREMLDRIHAVYTKVKHRNLSHDDLPELNSLLMAKRRIRFFWF